MAVPANITQVVSSLRGSHTEQQIAELVAGQLIKDFRTAGMELSIADCDYRTWIPEITAVLAKAGAQQLSAVLYSVDIPEKLAAGMTGGEEFASIILYREFVKIYYRLNYNPGV